MQKLEIQIKDTETQETETIESDGVLVLYLDGSWVKSRAKISLKALTPLITRAILERMPK